MLPPSLALSSGVKSILKLYLSKSIVTDGKTTRSKVESMIQKTQSFKNYSSKSIVFSKVKVSTAHLPMSSEGGKMVKQKQLLQLRWPSG